jgi:hypothetical protein
MLEATPALMGIRYPGEGMKPITTDVISGFAGIEPGATTPAHTD